MVEGEEIYLWFRDLVEFTFTSLTGRTFLRCSRYPSLPQAIETEGYYQIGKNYYEPLSLIQFDQASQAFLDFLGRMIPDEAKTNLTFILPNNARHLSLPMVF